MGINHQTQFNNITSAQNRLVNFNQGGALTRIYRNYEFTPNTESMWDFEVAKEYAEISKELISVLSNDRVVCICAAWKKKEIGKM